MSKNLVKILSICAMSILLLLTIVGICLCVTEPVMCSLNIEEGGITGLYAESGLAIRVEDEDKEGTSIKVKKNSEVTVVFSGEGYDFAGWFNGRADEIKDDARAVSFDKAYSFTVRGNTTLTAVRNVIKYTVTYAGFLDNGTTSVGEQIDELEQTIEYGAPLETLSSASGGNHEGWYVSSGSSADAQVFTTATFSQKEVEVKPKWSNQMLITYMMGDKVIATNAITEANVSKYNLLDANSTAVKNNVTPGYKFAGWVDGSNKAVTSITFNKNGVTLYLKESLITYTLNVKYNAVSSENASTIKYDAKNGFTAYSLKDSRSYYIFKGFDYKGTTYLVSENDYVAGANKLSDVVKAQTSTSINITAVWECEFAGFHFNFRGYSEYVFTEGEDADRWAVYGTKNSAKVSLVEEDVPVYFEDDNHEVSYDLTEKVFGVAFGAYSNFYVKSEIQGNYNVKLGSKVLVVAKNNREVEFNINGADITFLQILGGLETTYGNLEGIEEITIKFEFVKA